MRRIIPLIFKELAYRKANAVLAVIGVSMAVAVCVALSILSEASGRETRRIQRDIGFNLRIIPRETDMAQFYTSGYSQHTFAESAARETLALPIYAELTHDQIRSVVQRIREYFQS